MEWTLASTIVASFDAMGDTLITRLTEVLAEPAPGQKQGVSSPDAVHQTRLPVGEGRFGLASAAGMSGPGFISLDAKYSCW